MRLKRPIFLIFCLLSAIVLHSAVLVKPQHAEIYAYSGDNQTQTTGQILNHPIRVLVTDKKGKTVKQSCRAFNTKARIS